MEWNEYPEFLGGSHPDICGFASSANPGWEGFSVCNLKYGCRICRTVEDFENFHCTACGATGSGYVNDAGGMSCAACR